MSTDQGSEPARQSHLDRRSFLQLTTATGAAGLLAAYGGVAGS